MKKSSLTKTSEGFHNINLEYSRARLIRGNTYRDLSTVCIVPIRAPIEPEIVFCWWGMMTAMNQKFMRVPIKNMEVADAYNAGIEMILGHPELSKWKYVLTLETDNAPPPDGLLKLYEHMEKFDAIGGLYWTKGENGQPMIYGDPNVMPPTFVPQIPLPDTIQRCNGLGMGFTLFKLDMFRKVPRPWFRTLQEYDRNKGAGMATQDLYFFQNAAKYGFKFACDTRVRVGHFDETTGTMW